MSAANAENGQSNANINAMHRFFSWTFSLIHFVDYYAGLKSPYPSHKCTIFVAIKPTPQPSSEHPHSHQYTAA